MKIAIYATALLGIFTISTSAIASESEKDGDRHPLQCELNFDKGSQDLFISIADCGKKSAPIGIGIGSFGAIARLFFPGGGE